MDIMDIMRIIIITGTITITKKDILLNVGVYPVVIMGEEIVAMVTTKLVTIKNMPMMILIMDADPSTEGIPILASAITERFPEEMMLSRKEKQKDSRKDLSKKEA